MRALCAGVVALACAHAPAAAPAAPPTPASAIIQRTHDYFAAVDAHDDAALAPMLDDQFGRFAGGGRFYDRNRVLGMMQAQKAQGAKPRTGEREWYGENVRFFGDTAIETTYTSIGKDDQKDEEWVTLLWVRSGGVWKVAHIQSMPAGLDAERALWNRTFKNQTGFNLQPNKTLIEAVQGRPPGTALDIAMGQGRNALYLASLGWKVTGVDISDEGIRQAKDAAAKANLPLDAVQADVDKWDFGTEKWDLITLIYAGHGDPEKIRKSLKHGGLLVVGFFHKDAMKGTNIDGFTTNELPETFKDFKVLKYEEVEDVADWGLQKVKLVRFVAQKP